MVVVVCLGAVGFAAWVVEAPGGVVLLVVGVAVVEFTPVAAIVVEDGVVVCLGAVGFAAWVVEASGGVVAVVVEVVGVVVVVTWSIDSNFSEPILHAASSAKIKKS